MKQYISHNGFKARDRLPTEREWADMLGVSRLVVREALQTLAGSGLIDIQQGRGAFVSDSTHITVFDQLTFGLDLQQLTYTDVLEARAMLDLTVLELCMQRADQQALDELEQLLADMQQALERGESEHECHHAFHHRMLRAAGNPLIERVGLVLMETFWRIGDQMPNLIYPTCHAEGYNAVESHRMLLDAIKTRDLSQSRRLVTVHLPVESHVDYVFPMISRVAAAKEAGTV